MLRLIRSCVLRGCVTAQKTVYEDESTIGDHTLADNDVIYFVYKPGTCLGHDAAATVVP